MKVLVDTNILIYHVGGSAPASQFLNKIIGEQAFHLSILSVVEFLGWLGHTEEKFKECQALVKLAKVFSVDAQIADKAVDLRRIKKIKLADAIIASTAIVNNLNLATRNQADFKGIKTLEIINPFL